MAEPLVPAPGARQRAAALIAVALGEIAAAAALVRAELAFFQEHQLGQSIETNGGFNQLGTIEAWFFLSHVMAGLPAALLLTDAATRLLASRPAPWSTRALSQPRFMAFLLAMVAAVIAVLLEHFVLKGTALTDDEGVYLTQARHLLAGSFTAPVPGNSASFPSEFMIGVPPHRWAGVYPPGQPFLIAFGMLVAASPHLLQPLFVGAIVYVGARLAGEIWGAETSVITAALLASSPMLLFTGATLHNAVPATFFCLVAVRATRSAVFTGRTRHHALVGAALGAAFICRPYDTMAIGVPLLFVLVRAAFQPATPSTPMRGTAGLAWAVVCAIPGILLYLVSNDATTGNFLLPAYASWLEQRYPGAKTVGFGPAVFGGWHTTQLMFSKALVVISRLSVWVFGWPLSFWPLLVLVVGVGRDHRSRLILGVLGIHFGAYCLYTMNSVQDFGSPYHLVEIPFIAMLSARAISAMGDKLNAFGTRLAMWPGRFALTSAIIGLLTFWPKEIAWAEHTAAAVRAPLEAASNAAGSEPSLIFWKSMAAPKHQPGPDQLTWVLRPPIPGPKGDDQIIWVRDLGPKNDAVFARYPNRRAFRLGWDVNQKPVVMPYDSLPYIPDEPEHRPN
jgi:hypothetical protein